MTIITEFAATFTYDCVNPKNGRVSSSGSVFGQMQETDTGIAGGISLGTHLYPYPHVENGYSGKNKKLNACKSGNVVVFTGATIDWWYVFVDNEGDNMSFRYACVGVGDLPYGLHCAVVAS